MRKIIILIALMLSISTPAMSWESSVGVGYDHRHFGHDDQLGATSQKNSLHPASSSGLRLTGSWLWHLNKELNAGPEVSVGHSWLNAPHQPSYVTKTAGKIDTSNLTVQSVILSGKFQVLDWKEHLIFLKPGFLILNLNHGWDSVDTDTGAVLALEIASGLGERNRFSVDVQAILSPTVRGKNEYDLSFGMVLGVHQLFRSKPNAEVSQPVKSILDQKNSASFKVQVDKPEVVQAQALRKEEVSSPVPSPQDPTPVVVQPTQALKIKATLKFDAQGNLLPESEPVLEKILRDYKESKSLIKISYKGDEISQKRASSLASWFVSKGVLKENIKISRENIEKPIRIEVVPSLGL